MEATRRELQKVETDAPKSVDWTKIGDAIVRAALVSSVTGIVIEVTKEAVHAWSRARASGLRILQLSKTEARALRFPPGHPREGVLYIGHPATPDVYYTMADFHRVTFEHKFSEAVDLLMHLGATKIRVEHIHGWSQDFSGQLSVPLSPADSAGIEAGRKQEKSTQILFEATFRGSDQPLLPDRMVWYPHKPTWQNIAHGRIKFGLNNFSLSVSYEDDFGVNAGLKASVQKVGLELGGRFEDHVSTVWRISGEFGSVGAKTPNSYEAPGRQGVDVP